VDDTNTMSIDAHSVKQWVRDNVKAMFLIASSMEDAQLQLY